MQSSLPMDTLRWVLAPSNTKIAADIMDGKKTCTQVLDMVKAGFAASCMGVVILVSAAMLLAPLIFDIDFGKLPSWAEPSRV